LCLPAQELCRNEWTVATDKVPVLCPSVLAGSWRRGSLYPFSGRVYAGCLACYVAGWPRTLTAFGSWNSLVDVGLGAAVLTVPRRLRSPSTAHWFLCLSGLEPWAWGRFLRLKLTQVAYHILQTLALERNGTQYKHSAISGTIANPQSPTFTLRSHSPVMVKAPGAASLCLVFP